MNITTLGWLKYMEVLSCRYFEHQCLRFLHSSLTKDWQTIQGGVGNETWQQGMNIRKVLELDMKA